MITDNELLEKLASHDQRRKYMNDMSPIAYWKELGAVVHIGSRQTGKSTALRNIQALFPERYVLLTPRSGEAGLDITNPENKVLMVDEFLLMPKRQLDALLSRPWKAVLLVGSLV